MPSSHGGPARATAWAMLVASISAIALLGVTVVPSCAARGDAGKIAGADDDAPFGLEDLPRSRALPGDDVYRLPIDGGGEPQVRIRLIGSAERVTLDGPERLSLAVDGAAGRPMRVRTPVTLERVGRSYALRVTPGRSILLPRGKTLSIASDDPSTPISVNGAPHPGTLELLARDDSALRFDVIEIVGIEDYLPGVLHRELYASWKPETFEAQAIAARSYALHERQRSRNKGEKWDLESSTMDQAYGGLTSTSRAVAAVRATRGQVLSWNGDVLRAYYSSTSGGRSASASDVWPSGPGFEFNLAEPLMARDRASYGDFSPLHRWEVTRPADALVKRFSAFGRSQNLAIRSITSLGRVEVESVNGVGRPTRYRITDDRGRWWTLSAEQLRLACNTSVPGLPQVTRATRVNSGDVEIEIRRGQAVIRGRGFGHGVGMCQFGAEGMARRGAGPEEILALHYPGAEITSAY